MFLSVVMITYNHEAFVREAIESILKQETKYNIELIISNDNSKDNTDTEIKECIKNNKTNIVISYYNQTKNLGMMPNFLFALQKAKGKYIAICEGDDFWTDPYKLQKQTDWMERDKTITFCCHGFYKLNKNAKIIDEKDKIKDDYKIYSLEDYLISPFSQTASFVFKNEGLIKNLPVWYKDVLAGDNFLVLLCGLKGRIGYLKEKMSVYRIHDSSISNKITLLKVKENYLYHLKLFDGFSNFKYTKTIYRAGKLWELKTKLLEDIPHYKKKIFFFRNITFFLHNFKQAGGAKLLVRYLININNK